MVPRPRIELGTHGFSVRQDLLVEILNHFVAIGQLSQQVLASLDNNGHRADKLAEIARDLRVQRD
jgi:hypothetical protein